MLRLCMKALALKKGGKMGSNYEEIKENLKSNIETKSSLIEGSFTMDNINALSLELARIVNMEVDTIIEDVFLDSASGINLDKKVKEYGEKRNEALKAIGYLEVTGNTGVIIYRGSQFERDDGVKFESLDDEIISATGKAVIKVSCTIAGTIGNTAADMIFKVDKSLKGISKVINPEKITGGTDREDDETLRARIIEKLRSPITSGNKNHYKYWAKQVEGIKDAKVVPLANGNGTVRVIVLSDESAAVDDGVLGLVRRHIEDNRPVGASVEVISASANEISLNMTVKLESGVSATLFKTDFRKKLGEYMKSISFDESKVLSYFKVGDIAFSIDYVTDVIDYKINGGKSSIKSNFGEFFSLSEVVVNGS